MTIIPPVRIQLLSPDGKIDVAQEAKDLEGNTYGAGHLYSGKVDPRSLWRENEKKQWNDFSRLRRKWKEALIPVLQEEAKQQLLKRFKTTSPGVMALQINIQMMTDPRLNVLTRRGMIKTTASEQRKFAARSVLPKSRAKR